MPSGAGRYDDEVLQWTPFAMQAVPPWGSERFRSGRAVLMRGLRAGLRPIGFVSGRPLARTSHRYAM